MSSPVTPLLAHLWQKNRPIMLERLDLLDRAAAAPSDPELSRAAIEIAHKLAGSLGMFGYPQGTELARAIEVGLEQQTLTPDRQLELTRALRACLFPPTSM